MSSGLRYGFLRGYVNTLGLIMGIVTQVAVVGLGLGALLATSEMAFAVVKWVGVAYLVYLGVKQIRSHAGPVAVQAEVPGDGSMRQLVWQGFLVNVSNPKGTVFLLAVVPQFLNPAEPLAMQYVAIGATLAFTDMVAMAIYTVLAAKVLRLLRSASHIRMMNRVFGGLFIAAGVWLATFKRTA